MNQKCLYLTLDLLTLVFPLLFSFYPKADFSRKWKFLWPAIMIPGVLFIIWDAYFTRLCVWGFNEEYLTGIYIGNLPMEELLFFICIPYACVFTYEALRYLIATDYLARYQALISKCLVAGCFVIAVVNFEKSYTFTTFLALGLCVLTLQLSPIKSILGRFYFAYLFILVPFFIVNGILTGYGIEQPVVWYNDAENLGIRIGTIPIEDVFYGMLLVVMNVSIFEWGQSKL